MKRVLCLVLTFFLSGLTSAGTVKIIAEDAGGCNLRVGYEVTSGSESPVGFGLDIRLSNEAIFDSVVSASTCFPIYPGSVIINYQTGEITDYGTPIADASYPGTLGGIGTSGVSIEMGVEGFSLDVVSVANDPRDFNHDAKIDNLDLCIFASRWLMFTIEGEDLNGDVFVDFEDYGIFVDGRYDFPPLVMQELLLLHLEGNGAVTTVVTISENVIRGGVVDSRGMPFDVILPEPFTVVVPEPSTLLLLGLGGLIIRSLKSRKGG